MPRIAPLDDDATLTDEAARVLDLAERERAPDPRMARVLVRSQAGVHFLEFWSTLLYKGLLPHRLKEIVRIYLSAAEGCAYCTSVRSTRGRSEGVTDELLLALDDIDSNSHLSQKERSALRFARRFKNGSADEDDVFGELRQQFSDEEILELGIFCGTVLGGGSFAKLLHVVTWGEVCELRPGLSQLRDIASR